jgi:hypothetical protein
MAPVYYPIKRITGATNNLAREMLQLKEALPEMESCCNSGAAITFHNWLTLRKLAGRGGKNNVINQARWLSL